MSAEKKPRKRLAKLVSGLKQKIKGERAAPDVAAETAVFAIESTAPVEETISRRAVIAGYITDDRTKQTISGAVVELQLPGHNLQTVTRGDGFFYFLYPPVPVPIEQGQKIQYTLKVTVPHLNIYYGETTVQNIEVRNDSEGRPIFDPNANVKLRSTTLKGKVTRKTGSQPIEKALVRLRSSEAQTLTDKNGDYVLSGLQATKPATPENPTPKKPTVEVLVDGVVKDQQKIPLKAGEETIVDFSLP